MGRLEQLSVVATVFNFLLFGFIYLTTTDPHPFLLLVQLVLPVLVWEIILSAAFLPQEWIEECLGTEHMVQDQDEQSATIRTVRRILPCGDFSLTALLNPWRNGDDDIIVLN